MMFKHWTKESEMPSLYAQQPRNSDSRLWQSQTDQKLTLAKNDDTREKTDNRTERGKETERQAMEGWLKRRQKPTRSQVAQSAPSDQLCLCFSAFLCHCFSVCKPTCFGSDY